MVSGARGQLHPEGVNAQVQRPSTQAAPPQQSPGSPQQVSARQFDVGIVGAEQIHSPFTHVGGANASEPQYSAHWNSCGFPSQVQKVPVVQVHWSCTQSADDTRLPLSQQSGPNGTVPQPAPASAPLPARRGPVVVRSMPRGAPHATRNDARTRR